MIIYLEHLIFRAGIYQSDLARMIGCTEQEISRYCTGKVIPKEERLRNIAKALDVPVWRLFVDPEENVPESVHDDVYSCPHCGGALRLMVGKHY